METLFKPTIHPPRDDILAEMLSKLTVNNNFSHDFKRVCELYADLGKNNRQLFQERLRGAQLKLDELVALLDIQL